MASDNRGRVRGASKASQGSYLVVISNLPLKLDIQSHTKYSTISWRPIKDLLRNVINKREDGTDIRPQEGNPGTVHVWPESEGQCGYAMGTLQKRKHALRALHWLGGNSWYGRTLSVILYYDSAEGLQYIDSRWMRDMNVPIKLESFVSVSQKELLQRQPSCETPNMLLCLAQKGSIFSRQRFSGSLDAYDMGDGWIHQNVYNLNGTYPGPRESCWYPGEPLSHAPGYEHPSGRFDSTWPIDNAYPAGCYLPTDFRSYSGHFVPQRPGRGKRHRGNFSVPVQTAPVQMALFHEPSLGRLDAFPMDRNLPTSDDESVSAKNTSDAGSDSLRSVSTTHTLMSIHLDKPAGPIIADGSGFDLAVDSTPSQMADEKQPPKCSTAST